MSYFCLKCCSNLCGDARPFSLTKPNRSRGGWDDRGLRNQSLSTAPIALAVFSSPQWFNPMTTGAGRFGDHYLNGHLAPYLHAHHLVGTASQLLEANQPAGDMSDPASDDLVIVKGLSPGIHHQSDFGGGRFEERSPAGVFFFIPPGVATSIAVYNPHRIRTLSIDTATALAAIAEGAAAADVVDFGHLHKGSHSDDVASALFDTIWHVGCADEPSDTLLAQSLIMLFVRRVSALAGRKPTLRRGGLSPWQIRLVREALEPLDGEPLTLASLADLVGLSPFHFCRAFKTSLGVPPHRYQQLARVERARALLQDTDISVTEIAFQLGYGSSQAFARAFRREVGTSPREYRLARR